MALPLRPSMSASRYRADICLDTHRHPCRICLDIASRTGPCMALCTGPDSSGRDSFPCIAVCSFRHTSLGDNLRRWLAAGSAHCPSLHCFESAIAATKLFASSSAPALSVAASAANLQELPLQAPVGLTAADAPRWHQPGLEATSIVVADSVVGLFWRHLPSQVALSSSAPFEAFVSAVPRMATAAKRASSRVIFFMCAYPFWLAALTGSSVRPNE